MGRGPRAGLDDPPLTVRGPRAAAENGHLGVIRFLVENGADLNARLDTGETPLGLAEMHGPSEAASLLRSLGAKPG